MAGEVNQTRGVAPVILAKAGIQRAKRPYPSLPLGELTLQAQVRVTLYEALNSPIQRTLPMLGLTAR